jgi:outer membrane protein assembly factor BamB
MYRLALVLVCLSVEASADDWPHWRGGSRNDICAEDSRFERGAWPPADAAWETNVGMGSTSPVVAQGRLYVAGWSDDQDSVFCLDAGTGEMLWRQSYPSPRYGRHALGDEGLYGGMTSTPEFDAGTGLLFTLSVDGELVAWNTRADGAIAWRINLHDVYDVPQRPQVGRSGHRDYGYTSSVLCHDDLLVVEVGAAMGTLVAFDPPTGRELWRSQANDAAGHNGGPVPMRVEGVPCVALHTFEGLLVVRADAEAPGATIAKHPWTTDFANNIATPAVSANSIVLTSSYNQHKIARFDVTLSGARQVWEQPLASKVCSPLIHDGCVYWAWQELTCLDFETGDLKWQGGTFGDPGSCIVTADDRLIVLGGYGDLVLAETALRSPTAYTELAARRGLFPSEAWPHIILADGRLYCKDRLGNLVCFEL